MYGSILLADESISAAIGGPLRGRDQAPHLPPSPTTSSLDKLKTGWKYLVADMIGCDLGISSLPNFTTKYG